MKMEMLRAQLRNCDKEWLKKVNDVVYDEFRNRLIDLWELDEEMAKWSDVGAKELLMFDGEIVLDIDEVQLIIDKEIRYGKFMEWWEHNMRAIGKDKPTIHLYSWFVLGNRI